MLMVAENTQTVVWVCGRPSSHRRCVPSLPHHGGGHGARALAPDRDTLRARSGRDWMTSRVSFYVCNVEARDRNSHHQRRSAAHG